MHAINNTRNNNQVPFESFNSYDKEVMSGYYGKDVIFYGWNFHPKSRKKMFTKIRKVYNTDVHI